VLGGTPRYLGSVQVTGTEPYSFTTKLPVKPDKVLLDAQHSILANIHQ
jgi:hypothetical protein